MQYNVFVRRSRSPRGSNHDTYFLWPDVGGETPPIHLFKTDPYQGCGPGYYGYALDQTSFHGWNGRHWLAFEAIDPGMIRDHGDKIAVGQARTLCHGGAIDVARYLRRRGLPVPSILSAEERYDQAEIVRGHCPSDATAPRSGIGAVAYAISLDAHGTLMGRSTTAYQATGRYFHQIALGRMDWRQIDPDESSRWNDWIQVGGSSVCALEEYSREHMRQWQIGKIRPLPVYQYAQPPRDMLTARTSGSVCAVVLTAEPSKIVGWLSRLGSPAKRVGGLTTAKLHQNNAKAAERAKVAERVARAKAVKLASKAGQALDKIEAKRLAEYDRAFKRLGVVVTKRQTGCSWGRKSYAWDLKIGSHITVKNAWYDGEPDNREIMRRVTRYLAQGY